MDDRELTGKTQSYARYLNNRLVMQSLIDNGSSTATALATQLNLSNAAMSAIIEELRTKEYIKEAELAQCRAAATGRRPKYWTINENFGCVAVICLSDYVARIVISDMKSNITESVETRVEKYDVAMLYELALSLKNILGDEKYRNIPLLRIEFSMPGRVDMTSGELQLSKQFAGEFFSEKNFIVNLFERQFAVPVVLENDVNLAAVGEIACGLLKDVNDGMIIHVDEGIGGALVFGNKLYTGSRGFAGEFGLMHTQFKGKSAVIDEFVSLRAIREGLGADTLDGALAMYASDENAKRYVLDTARCLGEKLCDVVEILDISTIVLTGGVVRFGEEYIDALNGELNKSLTKARVFPSLLGSDAPVRGAIYKAVNQCLSAVHD